MHRWVILAVVSALVLIAGIALVLSTGEEAGGPGVVSDFEACVAAGYPVMETYPRRCMTPDGRSFTEEMAAGPVEEWITTRGNADIVRDVSVREGDAVTSPLTVTGEARGAWYFEGSFPVILTDWDGRIIAEHYASAQLDTGDPNSTWMTEEYVPFQAILEFATPSPGDPAVNRGALILQKDNPSGLPEHDDALEIPIVFE